MARNRGKQFEDVIRASFEKVEDTSVVRLPDPVMGYLGYRNICDFIVYHYPYQYFIECKSCHGNTLRIFGTDKEHRHGVITNNQWNGLLQMSNIKGVHAGVLCWWIDHGVTKWIPIQALETFDGLGYKSIRYDMGVPFGCKHSMIPIEGRRKKIFFDYHMEGLFSCYQDRNH